MAGQTKTVAVIHPDLTAKGGAESVAVGVLEALQDAYEVALLTVTDPDLAELNAYYNASVTDVEVRRAGPVTRWFNAIAEKRVVDVPVPRCRLFEQALFNRFVSRVQPEYDLLVSTYNEYNLGGPAVQYVHHPNYYLWKFPGGPKMGTWGRAYVDACRRVSGFTRASLAGSELLANSRWTSAEFERIYGHRPRVAYPPVDTAGFGGVPWEQREDGFVAISRISPDKQVLRGIRVVDALVERGYDTHIHVVGSVTSEAYYEQLAEATSNSSHVHVEGELTREELVDVVNEHKYGIHTKPHEHFGIAVAELVAGGAIPFVPSSGGQVEIVRNDALTYDSIDDAVEKIADVLDSPRRQTALRRSLPEIDEAFGRERFRREIRGVVAQTLCDS